jgi:hypothetical protein
VRSARCGRAGVESEDIAFAVAEQGHHRGLGQQRLGRKRGGDPALRFPVRQIALGVRDAAPAGAGPHLAAQQTETAAIFSVHGQHRVQQHPAAVALADLAEPAPAVGGGRKVDLAGALDRQDMAAGGGRDSALAPAFDHPGEGHLGIAEEPIEPHLLGALAVRKPPQADVRARDHAFEQRRPPLSRRRSPNRPNDQSFFVSMRHPRQPRSVAIQITRIPDSGIPRRRTESIRRTKMCVCLSARGARERRCR